MAFKSNSVHIEDAKLRRKLNKPLVEKRRRERINKYLYELHGLLSDADQTTPASKLEKADILEMAVTHIRNLKHKLRVKALETAAAQIEQSQRLQEAISPQPQLHVRIPSPQNNIGGSTGVPSPTPSMENTCHDLRLPITILIPQQHQAQIIQPSRHHMNTSNSSSSLPHCVRYQPYQLPRSTISQVSRVSMQSDIENIKPQAMWRPW